MPQGSALVTGILLAGGKSRRMGVDKGRIEIEGRSLYQITLGVLSTVCDRVMVSTCGPEPVPAGYLIVCDEVRGIGPMGGVYTCLRRSETELNLVISYDMPLVKGPLLRELLSQAEGSDMVVPAMEGVPPEPLCAVYRKSTANVMEEMIGLGDHAMHKLYSRVRTKVVAIGPHYPWFEPGLFLNLNRPEDLRQLKRHRNVYVPGK